MDDPFLPIASHFRDAENENLKWESGILLLPAVTLHWSLLDLPPPSQHHLELLARLGILIPHIRIFFSKYRHGAYGAWGTAQQSPTPGESPSMDFPDLSSALFLARC